MRRRGWTYARAGVDISRKSRAIDALVDQLRYRRKGRGKMLDVIGQFTGMIDFGDLALTLCTDGVGTKLLVAEALDKWDTVGIDCIAMNVNDTICVGAEPIALVDYIAMDRPDDRIAEEIGIGLEIGARLSNIDIVGGEIAILPEMVRGVDLSASCLGFVKKNSIVDGSRIEVGDAIIGLRSSGIHSNGLTLARKVLKDNEIENDDKLAGLRRTVGEELLTPTRIYVKKILKLLDTCTVGGMVNVTGGGLRNFVRLKKGVVFEIDSPIVPQKIFKVLSEIGDIQPKEMYQTFNMGMGFALVCPTEQTKDIIKVLGEGAKVVGEVRKGDGVGIPSLDLHYKGY
ncbi:MAG: phosphoribosylformylglycinamidine cyclo-ligase [Methanomassiliicoccales archaeon]|nr:phosphoribosylformylglycinamidine cyclo-ligase [Methanomassiliicoccales archaeon]